MPPPISHNSSFASRIAPRGKKFRPIRESRTIQGGDRYKGPGHNAVIFSKNAAYNVYHSYDANSNGASVLRIAELAFDDEGWPVSGGP